MLRRRTFRCAAGWLALLLLAACEPEATPLPAFIPPTAAASVTATPSPMRYGVSPEVAALAEALGPLPAADIDVVETADPSMLMGARYDVMIALGAASGWAESPVLPTVSLIWRPRRAPLNDVALHAIIADALVSGEASPGSEITPASVRTALANAGWPDGFDVTLGHAGLPGANAAASRLASVGLRGTAVVIASGDLEAALADGRVDAIFVPWTLPSQREALVERYGDQQVTDLYALPIRFLAVDGLHLTFDDAGWPVAARQNPASSLE